MFKITVVYPCPIIPELDKKIQEAMESIGAEWTGRGGNFEAMEREVCFVIKGREEEMDG